MDALRQYLKQHYCGVTAFANAMGVKRCTVHFWLSGRRFPNRVHLVGIMTATGLTFEQLIGGDVTMAAPKKVVKKNKPAGKAKKK